jgi:hypothetical protein
VRHVPDLSRICHHYQHPSNEKATIAMLLPDHIYRRVPHIWLFMGFFCLFLAVKAIPDVVYFVGYLLLSIVCIFRALWVLQARQRVTRQREVTVLTETQKLDMMGDTQKIDRSLG